MHYNFEHRHNRSIETRNTAINAFEAVEEYVQRGIPSSLLILLSQVISQHNITPSTLYKHFISTKKSDFINAAPTFFKLWKIVCIDCEYYLVPQSYDVNQAATDRKNTAKSERLAHELKLILEVISNNFSDQTFNYKSRGIRGFKYQWGDKEKTLTDKAVKNILNQLAEKGYIKIERDSQNRISGFTFITCNPAPKPEEN